MAPDWKGFCEESGLTVLQNAVVVTFASGRKHKVTVDQQAESLLLSGVVAKRTTIGTLETAEPLALRAWRRNRSTQLVGFRIDKRGRLVGEAWVPLPGLTPVEFRFYLHAVAHECDRFEYQLTGDDKE